MHSLDKTTYKDLSSTSPAAVNALLDPKTDSRKADLQRRLHDAIRNSAPAIGQYWKGQGGIYAGIIRDGDRQWHLILAEKPAFFAPWGDYGIELAGEFSLRDGAHNTKLILASDSLNEIAFYNASLNIDGHADFYWPSQCENTLVFANLPEHLFKSWHWSSSQYSSNRAWTLGFYEGDLITYEKDVHYPARAVRRIPIE